jgi:hypothetical protein
MEDLPGSDALARAVRSLARAVWVLVVLVLVLVAYSVWAWFQSMQMVRRMSRPDETRITSSSSPYSPSTSASAVGGPGPHRQLSCNLPPDDLVARSSAIFLTSYQPSGKGFKAVIAEIVKLEPGTTIEYRVGEDFFEPGLDNPREGSSVGDGSVVFLEGSPAFMRCSYSFQNGRIGGLGDMRLETLRALAGKKKP